MSHPQNMPSIVHGEQTPPPKEHTSSRWVEVNLRLDQGNETLSTGKMGPRTLSAQALAAQENERQRIAAELHDGLGQMLSAVKFRIENTVTHMNERCQEENTHQFMDVIQMIQRSIEEVRRISMDLRPSILDDLGIVSTLTWFCREFQASYECIRIEPNIGVREEDIPPSIKLTIFRIAQEAMNNAAKHTHADFIRTSLKKNGAAVELLIEDNGQGFDSGKTPARNNGGYGLASMRERAELSGGRYSLESIKGAGTKVRVVWPL